jgi:hypothetical protein
MLGTLTLASTGSRLSILVHLFLRGDSDIDAQFQLSYSHLASCFMYRRQLRILHLKTKTALVEARADTFGQRCVMCKGIFELPP